MTVDFIDELFIYYIKGLKYKRNFKLT